MRQLSHLSRTCSLTLPGQASCITCILPPNTMLSYGCSTLSTSDRIHMDHLQHSLRLPLDERATACYGRLNAADTCIDMLIQCQGRLTLLGSTPGHFVQRGAACAWPARGYSAQLMHTAKTRFIAEPGSYAMRFVVYDGPPRRAQTPGSMRALSSSHASSHASSHSPSPVAPVRAAVARPAAASCQPMNLSPVHLPVGNAHPLAPSSARTDATIASLRRSTHR